MSATSPRHSPSFSNSPKAFTSPSVLRNGLKLGGLAFENASPTSTVTESATGVAIRLDTSRNTTINVGASFTPRRTLIRSDPSLLTCFDLADKELYDLWAPKR
ncbi:hypothetical protein CPB84DRAFT_1840728 [Gymnopilus junonius]|uniref:Uncharacterized protein n=1 Tax=Gymnopilus junonius TaxID=109634 RepID=A0A9P5P412_GYMJU|nr:hypothetical protein CPB84DRAFT_1840728 [Gymnopilus junonius]